MKGIFKKLFLGLFFCALICAGFSKDVKAAIKPTADQMTIGANYNDGLVITVALNSAPSIDDTMDLTVKCADDAIPGGIHLQYDADGASTEKYWACITGPFAVDESVSNATSVRIISHDSNKAGHLSAIKGKASGAPSSLDGSAIASPIPLTVSCGSEEKNGSVTLYAPNATVKWNISDYVDSTKPEYDVKNFLKAKILDATGTSELSGKNLWMFENEKYVAQLCKADSATYDYLDASVVGTKADVGKTTDGTAGSDYQVEVTAGPKSSDPTHPGHFVEYEYTYDCVTKIEPKTAFSKPLATGYTSDQREFVITSALGGSSKWATKDVVESGSTSDLTFVSGDRFTVKFASAGTNKNVPVKIVNGIALGIDYEEKNFNVPEVRDVVKKIEFDTYVTKIEEDDSKEFIVKGDKALSVEGIIFEYSSQTYFKADDSTTAESGGKIYFDVDGIKEGSAKFAVSYDLTRVYDGLPSGTPGLETPQITIKVTKGSGPSGGIEFTDIISVTQGETVYLKNFINEDARDAYLDIAVDKYAKLVSGKTKKASLTEVLGKNVEVYGNEVTSGSKIGTIAMVDSYDEDNNDSTSVLVYPRTSVSINGGGSTSDASMRFGSNGSSSSSTNSTAVTVTVPVATYHGDPDDWIEDVEGAYVVIQSANTGKYVRDLMKVSSSSSSSDSSLTLNCTISHAVLTQAIRSIASGDTDTITIMAYPCDSYDYSEIDTCKRDKTVTGGTRLPVYRINLDGSTATYTVDGTSYSDYFYAYMGPKYTIKSTSKSFSSTSGSSVSGKFQKWEGVDPSVDTTKETITCGFSNPRTIKAVYVNPSSSSTSSTGSSTSKTTAGSGGSSSSSSAEGLDDVPKTGETKTDIWILWTVLLVSILGAGFMIYRRFGVVNAIAQADAEEAQAVADEMAAAQNKEKEDKLRVLRDLRDLK